MYYIVELEVVKKNADLVFGFINISHIPYSKLEKLFKDQITDERFLFDDSRGYDIDKKTHQKHKRFFDKAVPFGFDFNLFDYSVRLSGVETSEYKPGFHESLSLYFEK